MQLVFVAYVKTGLSPKMTS